MRFSQVLSLVFILATVCHSQVNAQQQQFTLPDFGVNKDNPTCQTVDDLIIRAQSDRNRLTNFLTIDVANAIKDVSAILSTIESIREIKLQTKSLGLLQVQASSAKFRSSSSSSSSSQIASALKEISEKLNSKEAKSQLYNDLIAVKIDEVTDSLLDLTKDATSQSSNFKILCDDILSRVRTLVAYLNYLDDQVRNGALKDLATRAASLNSFKTDCTNIPVTQTGQYLTNFFETGSYMQQQGRSDTRIFDATITFNQAFTSVPTVGLALFGWDIDQATPNVKIDALSVTTTGFTLRITATPYTRLYNVYVSYIATLSEKSGIYIINDSADTATDSQARAKLKSGTSGQRTYTKSFSAPASLSNPQSLALIKSFDFAAGYNPRLELTSNPNSVAYTTWDNSVLNSVGATILLWSGSDKSVIAQSYESTYNGKLAKWTNPGERKESGSFSTSNYKVTANVLVGVNHFDFSQSYNYRLSQEISGTSKSWNYQVKTWWDTQLYQAKAKVLFLCPFADKSKCIT